MRIAYDVAALLGHRTGIGHYAASLLENLYLLDQDLDINGFAVTSKPGDPAELKGELKRLRLPGRVGVTIWSALGTPTAERLLGDNDVVHGTNFWVPPLERKNGIVTIHDLTFLLYPEMCTPQIQRYRWIVPRVLQSCALVLTPSNIIKEQTAEELGFPEDRIIAIPPGVRGAFIGTQKDPNLERELGLVGPYVLFAGTQEPRKNLDRLIEAMRQLKDLQLLIVGPPGWGSADLEGVVHKLHLEKRVLFSGYLDESRLGALMAGAEVFAFPSIYEGFGLPPLEAMAAGTAVVAARAGSLPEALGDSAFWCDPFDVVSIADAIHTAVTDHPARSLAIEVGRRWAEQFTWKRTAEKTLNAYRQAAE